MNDGSRTHIASTKNSSILPLNYISYHYRFLGEKWNCTIYPTFWVRTSVMLFSVVINSGLYNYPISVKIKYIFSFTLSESMSVYTGQIININISFNTAPWSREARSGIRTHEVFTKDYKSFPVDR